MFNINNYLLISSLKMKIILLLLMPFISLGQWVQLGQDIDGDASEDFFGDAIDFSSDGMIVVIGAPGNDVGGSYSGHVKVYKFNGSIWEQIGMDINGLAANDYLGTSVSISGDGNIIAIGSTGTDVNGSNSGSVTIYENIGGVWQTLGQTLLGDSADDSFGLTVGLSYDGSILAIGAPNHTNSGVVKVFELVGNTWIQLGQNLNGEAVDDGFGRSLSLSPNGVFLAIGANENDGNGSNSGHVRVYENIAGSWSQIGQDIDGEAEGDWSGYSVEISSDGSKVAIGAILNDGTGLNGGHVRVFESIGGTWFQLGQDIDSEDIDDSFGWSVSFSNDASILAIGANRNDGNGTRSGHVRVFRNVSGSWTQIGNDVDGENSGDGFGKRVVLSSDGSRFAASGWLNDANGTSSGHVRIFENSTLSIGNNHFDNEITVYPNPTFGVSNINLGNSYNDVELYIINSFGTIIKKEMFVNTNCLQINTGDFSSGVYIIKIISGNKKVDLKLIKG